MLIGFDNGFGQVKAHSARGSRKFLAAVAQPSVFQLGDDRQTAPEDNLIVELNSRRYIVGPGALKHEGVSMSTTAAKFDDEHDYAKLLAMLGLYAETRAETVELITGLPVHEFQRPARDRISTNWGKRHDFSFRGRPYTIHVPTVKTIPQAAGAYYSVALDRMGNVTGECAERDVLVIDVGYRTTDIVTMKRGEYASDMSGTVFAGIGRLHNEVRKRINLRYRYMPKLAEMDGICRAGAVTVGGKQESITDLIHECALALADQVWNELGMYVDDVRRVGEVLLAGGGTELLGQALQAKVGGKVAVHVIPNPEYANAVGYYHYGELLRRAGRLR